MNRYDLIKNNIIYEENIYYKKNGKQYIGCLVKSKYADNSEQFEFYLFENRTTRNVFLCLDLIEYERVEQKKDTGWKSSGGQKMLFYFELIPKHQQQKEIFASETEENRTKWMKIFNENIHKLNSNTTYEFDTDDEKLSNDDNTKPKPAVLPKTFNSQEINKKLAKPDSSQSAMINQLHQILLKPKKPSLTVDEIFYRGTFDELNKILLNINKAGVYAVTNKIRPESDCTMALRVYENAQRPISSWNIYQNEKTNEYFLFDDGLTFLTIPQLCLYYTENDLPGESNIINRLMGPYKYYLQ